MVENSCILLFTETWLQPSIPDEAIELAGRTAHRHNRSKNSGNNSWCTNTKTVSSLCSSDLEFVTVKCRPIYLPREFTVVMVTAVYIPPDC